VEYHYCISLYRSILIVVLRRNPAVYRAYPGRPRIEPAVEERVVRLARENSGWGYDRIVGALANLDHHLSDQTVGNILRRHDIAPAPNGVKRPLGRTFGSGSV
jgi:hypothetical protein